jgi:ATP/maltotriose-dependent transcriptional regulator MalT
MLDRATRRPLTVVVAPAGTGKSAMLRGWAAQQSPRKHRVLWVDCRGPGRTTAANVAAALSQAGSGRSRSVIVLDDAHLLRSRELQAAIDFVAGTGGRSRVVLASRRDLALPLVRLELADEVTTLRAVHLRFTDVEASRLIAAHANNAAEADVRIVRERSQGWAAALVLGARAVAAASDPVSARKALSSTEQPVLDYLLSEVFDTLDAPTRHVLLCTCSNDTVSEHDAVVMSRDEGAAQRIARLAAEGFLVTAVPNESGVGVWSYHPLLQELLRRRVMHGGPEHSVHEEAEVRVIEDSALHGDIASALLHATYLHQRDRLVGLLSVHGLSLIASGERDLVAQALEAVPEDLERGNAGLAVLRALERRNAGELKVATRLAGEALELGARQGERTSPAWSEGGPILLCWLARAGLLPARDAIALATERVALDPAAQLDDVSGHGGGLSAVDHARAWLLTELAVVECWQGELDDARTHLDSALVMARSLGADLLVTEALAHASLVDLARGSYASADRRAREVITQVAASASAEPPFVAAAHVVHAWVALNDLDLAACQQQVQIVRGAQVGELDLLVDLLTHLIECHLLAHGGSVQEARAYLETPPPVHAQPPRFLRRWYAQLRGCLALLDRDVEETADCSATLRTLGLTADADVIDALLMDLRGDREGCLERLDHVLVESRRGTRQRSAGAAAALYRTWLALQDNGPEQAVIQLQDVRTRIAPHHLLVLADVGREPSFVELVAGAAVQGGMPGAADLLVVLRGLAPDSPSPVLANPHEAQRAPAPVEATSSPSLVIDLTSREVDVLRELSLGGSYTDIAATLFITENTVKTHLASLYRKLGATRRGEALRTAREAGLLQL